MTKTESTSKVHEFLPSDCRYQWAADHDDADCLQTFQRRQAADRRFLDLRATGYTGAIDQDGYAVEDVDVWIATHTEVMR